MSELEVVSETRCFGGRQVTFRHASTETKTPMRFAAFVPPQADAAPAPAVWFLAGLGCTEDNFMQKAGAQRRAAELGLVLIAPDTSPRGPGVPDDPAEAYDFGLGAGFYVDATAAPWRENYRMFSYLAGELPTLAAAHLPVDPTRQAVMGHSMGGHGALVMALRHPGRFRSVSAFAPICAPSEVPWGEKALGGYLGDDRAAWRAYDAVALVEDGARCPAILVDQGEVDAFLPTQLRPERLEAACEAAGQPLHLRRRPGYDHGYFFVATFVDDHLAFHAARLRG